MSYSPPWEKAEVELAASVLANYRANEFAKALAAVEVATGRSIHPSTLRRAFSKHGLKPPVQHMRGPGDTDRPPPDTEPQKREASGAKGVSGALTRILVCPDIHFPFEDRLAWETFLEVARVTKPDVLVFLGDAIDCYSISQYPKNPERKINLKSEVDHTNRELDRVCRLGIPRVIFCAGNHEHRLERYLCEKAKELYGFISMRNLLRIDERGFEWVDYRKWIRIGKCHFTHEVGRCGINTARQSLIDFGHNLVVGHSHRAGVAYQGTVDGEEHFCINSGWLGSYDDIDYAHASQAARDWQHAFSIVMQDASGYSWGQLVPIVEGRCIVDGRVISGRKSADRVAA